MERIGGSHLTVNGATVDSLAPALTPFSQPTGQAVFGVSQRKIGMRISDADVWSTTAQLNIPARPFTFIGWHDPVNDTITIELDNGTTQTVSITGANTQSGDLIIGAGAKCGRGRG